MAEAGHTTTQTTKPASGELDISVRKATIPNFLTILRIFFVPLLVALLVQENLGISVWGHQLSNQTAALTVFLVAGLTDLLDGYLARRWKQVTTVGTLLDPIADKLLISAALIALVQVRAVPAWMVIVVVGREFAVTGLRSIAAAEGFTIQASELGKSKMVSQILAVALLILGIQHEVLRWPALAMMWLMVGFALVSGTQYFLRFWSKLDRNVKSHRRRELLAMETAHRQRLLLLARQARARGRATKRPFRLRALAPWLHQRLPHQPETPSAAEPPAEIPPRSR